MDPEEISGSYCLFSEWMVVGPRRGLDRREGTFYRRKSYRPLQGLTGPSQGAYVLLRTLRS